MVREIKPVDENVSRDRDDRRRELFLLRLRGLSKSEAIDRIVEKYGVARTSVIWDWKSMHKWAPKIADGIDGQMIISEVWATDQKAQDVRLSSLRQIDRMIAQYEDEDGNLDLSPNSPVLPLFNLRERYLKALTDGNKSLLQNAIKTGILREQPSRVIVDKRELRGTIDFNKLLGDLSDEEREEFLSKLEEAFEAGDQ